MRALQTKVPVPVQAHPRKSAVGNCSTCQRLRPYCSHVVDNCSTCQRHCVNGCDWRAGLCERLRTTSCIHELAVQDAMHSAPIAKRVLSAIAWITHARTWLRSIPRWTPSSSLSDIMEELPDCFIAVSVLDKHAAESTVHDDKPTFTKRSSSVRSNRSWHANDIGPVISRNNESRVIMRTASHS